MAMEQTDIYTCPHCGLISPINLDSFWDLQFSFGRTRGDFDYDPENEDICEVDNSEDLFRIEMKRCEECSNDTVSISCICGPHRGLFAQISPKAIVKKYPEYIPLAIRQDYEEACAVTDLSPKAAATLARRCLQGIIRDFWKVNRKSLSEEINALRDLIDPKLWQAIDDIRKIGNIGAHMEKDVNRIIDVDPNEAEIILSVIEHILKSTYIARESTDKLLNELHAISENKQALKKSAPPEDDADRVVPSAAITGKQGISKQAQENLTEQGKKLAKRKNELRDL